MTMFLLLFWTYEACYLIDSSGRAHEKNILGSFMFINVELQYLYFNANLDKKMKSHFFLLIILMISLHFLLASSIIIEQCDNNLSFFSSDLTFFGCPKDFLFSSSPVIFFQEDISMLVLLGFLLFSYQALSVCSLK